MTTLPSTATADHDATGRFVAGNRGGPGNPLGRRAAEMRQILIDALTDDALRKLADAMVARAQEGSVTAAKLLLSYTLGKPPAAAECDGPDTRSERAFPTGINPAARQDDAPADPVTSVPSVPPGRKSPASRKAMKRMLRDLRRGKSPSPNGSIGNGATAPAGGANRAPDGPVETVRAS
jgi:hypothetical protein